MHSNENNILVNFSAQKLVLKMVWCFTEQLLNLAE